MTILKVAKKPFLDPGNLSLQLNMKDHFWMCSPSVTQWSTHTQSVRQLNKEQKKISTFFFAPATIPRPRGPQPEMTTTSSQPIFKWKWNRSKNVNGSRKDVNNNGVSKIVNDDNILNSWCFSPHLAKVDRVGDYIFLYIRIRFDII